MLINFLILFSFSLFNQYLSEKILFAFQINRHGGRAPHYGVINGEDMYKEKWIENKELSSMGRRQLYLLGVKVRKKYYKKYGLISSEYNPQEIYIRSTDTNRTIESIYSYLQGLYPSGSGPIIKDNVYENKSIIYPPNKKYYEKFDRIIDDYNMNNNKTSLPYQMSIEPIHIFYAPDHEFELYNPDLCPSLRAQYEKQNERQEIKDFADKLISETNNLFFDLEPKAKNNSYFHDFWQLYNFTENIIADKFDVRDFNKLKNQFPYVNDELIDKLYSKSKQFIVEDSLYTNKWINLSIVGTSYTMHSLLNWMDKAINSYKNGKNENYIKFVIYSAHDSSIANLEGFMYYAFNLSIEFTEFADCRFFELCVDDEGKFFVKYLKADNTEKLKMNYDEFKNIVNNKTWSDEQVSEFCKFNDNKNNKDDENNKDTDDTKYSYIILIVLGCLNGILIGILIFIFIWYKKS